MQGASALMGFLITALLQIWGKHGNLNKIKCKKRKMILNEKEI